MHWAGSLRYIYATRVDRGVVNGDIGAYGSFAEKSGYTTGATRRISAVKGGTSERRIVDCRSVEIKAIDNPVRRVLFGSGTPPRSGSVENVHSVAGFV